MSYDDSQRSGAPVFLIGGCVVAVVLAFGGVFAAYFMFNARQQAEMEAAMAAEQAARIQEAGRAGQEQLAALQAAQAAQQAANDEATAAEATRDAEWKRLVVEHEKLLGELDTQRKAVDTLRAERAALQKRFDKRVADDEEMVNTLRMQLNTTRGQLAEAQMKANSSALAKDIRDLKKLLDKTERELWAARARTVGGWRDQHWPGGAPDAQILAVQLGDVIGVIIDSGADHGLAVGDTLVAVGPAGGSAPDSPTTLVVREVMKGFAHCELTAVQPATEHPYVRAGEFVRKRE